MSDWQIGDLALCINDRPDRCDPLASLLNAGRVYTVAVIGPREFGPGLALGFRDLPVDGEPRRAWGWSTHRFLKVTPPAADAFDTEVIEQMKGAPVDA